MEHSKFILIVAANALYGRLLVANLTVRNFHAASAVGPEQAALLAQNLPASLLLVCANGEATGEVLAALRGYEALADLPLILISHESPPHEWISEYRLSTIVKYPIQMSALPGLVVPFLSDQAAA